MAELDTFAATVTRTVVQAGGRRVDRFRLVRNRAGSFLMVGTGSTPSVAYDTPTDTLRRSGRHERGRLRAPLARRKPAWRPGLPTHRGSTGRCPMPRSGLRCARSPTSRTWPPWLAGRRWVDSWVLEAAVADAGRDQGIDRVTLVVDRAHLSPVRVSYSSGDVVVRSVRFREVAFDGLTPDTFSVDPGPGVRPVDRGFRTVGLTGVDAAIGRERSGLPSSPAGYRAGGGDGPHRRGRRCRCGTSVGSSRWSSRRGPRL